MRLLQARFGLDVASIDQILLNGARASFLPAAPIATFQAELDVLKAEHLTTVL